MNALTLLSLVLALAATTASGIRLSRIQPKVVVPHPHDTLTFDEFVTTFKKSYKTEAEIVQRQAIYESNKRFVAQFNKRTDMTFTVGINAFADLTAEEFAAMTRMQKNSKFEEGQTGSAPASMDWRKTGCTPPVANQGQCGAVVAVVATELVESMECIENKDIVHLSEQQLIDCVLEGCNGGIFSSCLDYCKTNGLATMQQYPSSGTVGQCKTVPGKVKCAHVYNVPSGNETALTEALGTVGPVACGIDASQTSFQLYRSGVYNDARCSSTEIDHMVLNVGYDTTASGLPYYILQNSWGSSWGENGFIMLARNAKNMCGIATDAVYVTL